MYTPSKHLMDFCVAGMRYWDGALVLNKLEVGDTVAMVAEPDNPYDSRAVALVWNGAKLGYIPRERNGLVAQLLAFGHSDVLECRILSVQKDAETWEQVHVGVFIIDKNVPVF